MKNKYYPFSKTVCHHFYNNNGCTFCGYHSQKMTVSGKELTSDEMIQNFDKYAKKYLDVIQRYERLIIAPNGSWFTQVPRRLREHIYDFIDKNSITALKYECRASLFNPDKASKEFLMMYNAQGYSAESITSMVDKSVDELSEALKEIKPNHIVSFGLEVADDADLKILNKGCTLEDYIDASRHVHEKGAKVGANILIAPPRIENPIYKAFMTAKFAVDKMGASEFLIMPCGPMRYTCAYDDWINARWDPISSTASSEIFRTIREAYPDVRVDYKDGLRIFAKHGRHGKFKRESRRWTDEEKRVARKEVRQVFEALTDYV